MFTHLPPLVYFYPRPPRGGRQLVQLLADLCFHISIHALREEGDLPHQSGVTAGERFLSTPSARRATCIAVSRRCRRSSNFYPRPPRGGRPKDKYKLIQLIHFYPRPPRGGRPRMQSRSARPESISIHALREEGDVEMSGMSHFDVVFLSTPSARRATAAGTAGRWPRRHFYPRPPRGGRHNGFGSNNYYLNFYPRPPRGGRPGQEEQK